MPKFDYRCDECEDTLELEHSMAINHAGEDCPNIGCLGVLRKIFTPPATHFKGQGWGKVYRDHKPKSKD